MTMYSGDEFYGDDVTSGFDDELDCTWCAGEGEAECLDPIGCTVPHAWNEPCICTACRGTGLRSNQTVF